MDEVFVDTAGWICYFDRSQPQHNTAATLLSEYLAQGKRFVTTNYIITEVVALLVNRSRVPFLQMVDIIEALKVSEQIEIVHIDSQLDNAAWELLKARSDKSWSLVDCTSFVVMQARGITEALTTDRDFEQAGFVRLLRS